jgi:hypothetical protein
MNIESLSPNHKRLAAIVGGSLVLIAAVLFLDGSGGSAGSNSLRGSVKASSDDLDVDVCSFLTSEDIEAATGIAGMVGHDDGISAGTGSRVCKFDTGNGMLPTLTIYARAATGPELPDGSVSDESYLAWARQNYQGEDIEGLADGAYLAGGHVFVQRGEVLVEITTLVMKGYLPGKIEGDPLVELARAAAHRMPPASES